MNSYPLADEASITSTSVKPNWHWVCSHWTRLLAFGFGSGLSPRAPGTVGSLAAVPLFWLLSSVFPSIFIFALCVPLFALGVWVCERAGRDLGVADHGGIVWDEIVAFLLVLSVVFNRRYSMMEGAAALALSFALFRLFDIVKPFPIKTLEQNIKGGLGVMIDDLFAAVYALIAFYACWALIVRWI